MSVKLKGPFVTEREQRLQKALKQCVDALKWCSGSYDFCAGGLASKGWENIGRPAIAEGLKALKK